MGRMKGGLKSFQGNHFSIRSFLSQTFITHVLFAKPHSRCWGSGGKEETQAPASGSRLTAGGVDPGAGGRGEGGRGVAATDWGDPGRSSCGGVSGRGTWLC